MQEQTPDTVLEQQPAAAEPEAQAQAPAEDTQQPAMSQNFILSAVKP